MPARAGPAPPPPPRHSSHPWFSFPSVVRADRRCTGDVAPIRDGLPDPVRQQRHVDVAAPGVPPRVDPPLDERPRATDGPPPPHPLPPPRLHPPRPSPPP